MKVRTTCKWCKKEFRAEETELKRGGSKYCSLECGYAAQRKGEMVLCQYCGKEFYASRARLKTGKAKFCSQECAGKWRSENLIGTNNPTYNKVKLNCDFCGKVFFVPQSQRTAKYCSTKCAAKGKSENFRGKNSCHYKERIKTTCGFCGKEIFVRTSLIAEEFGNFCSTECAGKWRSENLIGEKNANYKGKTKTNCAFCGNELYLKPSEISDKHGNFCSKECYASWQSENLNGENSPAWKGGRSFEPYCEKFNDAFKERIRDKFDRICFICGKTEAENGVRLSIHHVDYDKTCLCNTSNSCQFVPLCHACHTKTNHNRDYWQQLIMNKLRTRIDGYYI